MLWSMRTRQICLVVQLLALVVWGLSSLVEEIARAILLWRPRERPSERSDQPN